MIADAAARYDAHMLAVELSQGVAAVWDVVDAVNKYLVEKEPWKLAKDPARRDELAGVLYASAETLRVLAVLIQPIMPGAAQRLWEQLGIGGRGRRPAGAGRRRVGPARARDHDHQGRGALPSARRRRAA